MAAFFGRVPRKRSKRVSSATMNYYAADKGRRYRVCVSGSGRVLMVMLEHKHKEQALGENRRAGEIIRLVEAKYGVELRR